MFLRKLQLIEFRNIERLQIDLLPRINFFVGENGQGKTNILEAVYLLCKAQSFRPTTAESFLRNGGRIAKIAGDLVTGTDDFRLDHHVEMKIEQGLRAATINGKKNGSVGLAARFPVVLFSPESLSVIKDGPEERRQLIDEVLINHDPRQAQLLREFTRALRSRNRLLRNLREGLGSRRGNEDSLESLNKIYFLLATHLSAARIKALRDLAPDIQIAMTSILDETTAQLSVDYVISSDSAINWSESEVFDALHKRHRTLAPQEINAGVSFVGPHKHDIKLLFAGNDSRFYCSQGQQRALILALKIAQIVYHHRVHRTYPALLLDDVMSELDAKKRVNLMKFLEGISAQILMTATDLTWPEQIGADRNSVFSVKNGRVNA